MTAWTYLLIAAAFEIAFAVSMKLSEGFTRLWPTLVTVVGVVGGITFLTLAMKTLPVSVAYPAWTAIGALGTVIIGAAFLGESITLLKAASAAAIVVGVMGLRAAS
jgi:quaternary ammonium compound-resistance protein SugE